MSQLVLKRASASRPSGQWRHEDYDVLADGKVVGRICEDASGNTPPELRWFPGRSPRSGRQHRV
jgi:hypothetical protein